MTSGQDWMFWGVAAVMALAVAGVLVRALLRGRAAAAPGVSYDLRVYRDQLAEIDRDGARGVIGADEALRLRSEVSRRVLEADRALAATVVAQAGSRRGALVVAGLVVVVVAGAFWGYWRLGVPGYADLPYKARIAAADELRVSRPSQAEAEAQMPASAPPEGLDPQYLDLVTKLRATVAARPGDVQGLALLANGEAQVGNFAAAYAAQVKVVELKGPDADAGDDALLAELMILAAGGYVSPQAEAALSEALKRDPENGLARYFYGLMLAQIGRPDQGFEVWRALLESSAPTDPWLDTLASQIGDMAAMAGVNYQPATSGLSGPSQSDMAAAANMTDAERTTMIEGMVAQLNDRLATEGGTAQEWARLIGAYGVLGKPEDARRIWGEAQTRFAAKPDELAVVRASAVQAGVAE